MKSIAEPGRGGNGHGEHAMADVLLFLQGKLYIRGDSKIFRFQNGKTESLFLQRKNPRRIAWTTLFRRMHKKGISEVSLSALLRKGVKMSGWWMWAESSSTRWSWDRKRHWTWLN